MKKTLFFYLLIPCVFFSSCKEEVTSIKITPSVVSLPIGETTQQLTFTYFPSGADRPIVEWITSDSKIVSIVKKDDISCTITGVSVGNATITCTELSSGKKNSSTCEVSIYTNAYLSTDKISLEEGSSVYLNQFIKNTSSSINWTISDPKIGLLTNEYGDYKLTALKVGECTLNAQLQEENVSFSCKLEVTPVKPTGIESVSEIKLLVSEEAEIPYTVYPQNAVTTVTLSSSNPNVVEVVEGMKIKAKQVGSATLTLVTDNNITATVNAYVVDITGVVSARLTCPGSVVINGTITGNGNICATLTNNSSAEITITSYTIYYNNGTSILASRSYESDGFSAVIGGQREHEFYIKIACSNIYMPSCQFTYEYQGVTYVASAKYSLGL